MKYLISYWTWTKYFANIYGPAPNRIFK